MHCSGLLAGVFVDRWPLKPAMVVSDLSRAGLCLLLLVARSPLQFYAIFAFISVFSSFFGPAQGVAIRSAVPPHGLRSANALMQQVLFGMRIVGPAIAGVLYVRFGARTCYIGDSISFLCSGLIVASLTLAGPAAASLDRRRARPCRSRRTREGLVHHRFADMREGISFIVHHAALLFVILALATGIFVVSCFGPLIAVYIRDSIHGGTRLYSWASGMLGHRHVRRRQCTEHQWARRSQTPSSSTAASEELL